MEAESRAWMVQCPHCGFERSVWETGGVRYKAAGTSRNYRRCPSCGRLGWQKIYWKGDPNDPRVAPASAGFVIRLVLGIVFGVLIATGLILFIVFKLTGLI
jgi:endogenous inhibitor of DNA gyrase (YacG/DUF329 family)